MDKDNIVIVIFLVIGIVLFSNLAMFAMVRRSHGMNFNWFKNMLGSTNQPFKNKDDSLDELHRRVEELENSSRKEQ